ncbi:HD domain-containing protein [Marinomonas sp. TW1]|uniref:HD domain-containing protein n=1 Tax=Marinomonas sp. TW1 TaxID=1561203 RepID=UPI0007AFCC5F|nr:HD domain-containing protein [Marinomonas sp. TW1]KZN12765.1 phosphohydrolase [Marinomonas sp. TW1]
MLVETLVSFEQKVRAFLLIQESADVAHDLNHICRVVKVAKQLAIEERAEFDVVVPAAWLHDCVSLPKNHPQRAFASSMAADKAVAFLRSIDYPERYLEAIHHCICAHSFSAQITPKTTEAKIVQDADRLDALGAIGVARCMQVSGALNRALYDTDDPFGESRPLDDEQNSIDHFYVKLFNIADSLNTAAARREGKRRENFMRQFLIQLKEEI